MCLFTRPPIFVSFLSIAWAEVPGDAWESDLQLLRAVFDLARVPGAPLTGARIAQLQAALDRYRGDFLAGFSISDAPEFDDWVAAQRELWHGRADLVWRNMVKDAFADPITAQQMPYSKNDLIFLGRIFENLTAP